MIGQCGCEEVVLAALHAVHCRFVLPEMSFYKLRY